MLSHCTALCLDMLLQLLKRVSLDKRHPQIYNPRLKQEDYEFQANLSYILRIYFIKQISVTEKAGC